MNKSMKTLSLVSLAILTINSSTLMASAIGAYSPETELYLADTEARNTPPSSPV